MAIPSDIIKDEMGVDNFGNPITIIEKYRELMKTIIRLYGYRVWFLTEAALSVHVACLFEDIVNPIGLILVDGPSTEKTTVLDFFDGLSMNYLLDKFTPASFLSQAVNVKKEKLKNVDLLPKIVYKVLMVPELAPLFNQPKEILMENYALLARLFDGNGLSTAGGVHGERRLTGDYMFGFLGATTPLTQTAWNTMSKVGSRLIFLNVPARLSKDQRKQRALDIMQSKEHYRTKKRHAKTAIKAFLDFFIKQVEPVDYSLPEDIPEHLSSKTEILKHCGYLPRSVTWKRDKDNPEVLEKMALLAEFLTACRADVRVWTEINEDGNRETNSTGAVTEGVDRFTSIIYNYARCHALIAGRDGIDWDDIPLIIAVTLSSLPDDRRKAVDLLLNRNINNKESKQGTFNTSELAKAMSCTDKTAKTVMEKLMITGIGHFKKGLGADSSLFTLHEDYDWFISDDFWGYYNNWRDNNVQNLENTTSEDDIEDIPF